MNIFEFILCIVIALIIYTIIHELLMTLTLLKLNKNGYSIEKLKKVDTDESTKDSRLP